MQIAVHQAILRDTDIRRRAQLSPAVAAVPNWQLTSNGTAEMEPQYGNSDSERDSTVPPLLLINHSS